MPTASFEGKHLEWAWTSNTTTSISSDGKPLGSHTVGWKYPIHLNTPTMIGFIIGGRVHQKSSARKVTHPDTIPTLGSTSFNNNPLYET